MSTWNVLQNSALLGADGIRPASGFSTKNLPVPVPSVVFLIRRGSSHSTKKSLVFSTSCYCLRSARTCTPGKQIKYHSFATKRSGGLHLLILVAQGLRIRGRRGGRGRSCVIVVVFTCTVISSPNANLHITLARTSSSVGIICHPCQTSLATTEILQVSLYHGRRGPVMFVFVQNRVYFRGLQELCPNMSHEKERIT
jgi:hypothetical protein